MRPVWKGNLAHDRSILLAPPAFARKNRPMVAALPWVLLATTLLQSAAGRQVPPEAVPPAPGVRDPVFAYLIGMIDMRLHGTIDSETLAGAIGRSGNPSVLPYDRLATLSRLPEEEARTNRIDLSFRKPLRIPVPYRILGYAPGSFRASRRVELREWDLGGIVLRHDDPSGPVDLHLSDVHLFGILEGEVLVDVDGWLDSLLGGRLDDTRITGLVLFRHAGELWGMAVGYNRAWKGRSGLFSFKEDRIRFPSPPQMKTTAWKMRQILEGLEPSLRPDSLRASTLRDASRG